MVVICDLVRIGTTLASKSRMAIAASEEEEDDNNCESVDTQHQQEGKFEVKGMMHSVHICHCDLH